jgi:DNA-binding NarL/FixJ family response regulator
VSTRVLIADDQALLRAGFRKLLEAAPDIEVVGEAADGEEAVAKARRLRPTLVLMDIRMPRLDGIEATRRLISTDADAMRVLILTTFGLDDYVYDALRAGASGFMLKDAPPEELLAAIEVVARGDALIAPAVTRAVIEEFARRSPAPSQPPALLDELTAREHEVLELLARGLSNAEIAERLVVSPGTAKTHVAHVLSKLGLRDRVQAVILAYESGVITPGHTG